jgi:drug/metabolite transporter (DMT)-like permease
MIVLRGSPPGHLSLHFRAALVLGILGIAGAAILIRFLEERSVSPLVVGGYRMLLASLLLAALALRARKKVRTIARRDALRLLLASLFLAGHFASFTAALYHGEVARVVLLTHLQPLLVVLSSWWLFGERPTRWLGGCMGLAVLGVFVMSVDHLQGGSTQRTADLLGLVSAATLAGYLVVGRSVRQRIPNTVYASVVYGLAALALLVSAAAAGAQLVGFEPQTWLLFLLLAIIPTLCGHTIFNWALEHLPAATVSLAFLGEPPAAALLAVLFLGEIPGWSVVLGGTIALIGIGGMLHGPPAARRAVADRVESPAGAEHDEEP